MSGRLHVHYEDYVVGTIELSSAGRMRFAYSPSWLELPDAFPVSISLPLDNEFTDEASHSFFANLLPEGHAREQICRSLKISIDNDFALLKAIGGDCAGALSIADSAETARISSAANYQAVSEQQLAVWSVGAPEAFAAVTGHGQVRLSLAGAQDKLPVHVENDQVYLPMGNTPSTHILKFASRFYSHLPENEAFVALLARETGLPVVDVSVRQTAKAPIALIRRYDRTEIDGRTIRLHQEDFCQALGIRHSQKYEREGGPSLKRCADLIRRCTGFPLADLQKLLHWTFFNICVGNADAHGKNLSLIYDGNGTPRLAPFYDLVCTRNYKAISREMAMCIGGAWDPDLITSKHLEGLASEFGIRPKLVVEQFHFHRERIQAALPAVSEAYSNLYGDSPVLERLPIAIRKINRRLRTRTK